MAFIQSIEFTTEQPEAMHELMGRWTADAMGPGTAQRATMLDERSAPGRSVLAVWFESHEAAAQNSARPETGVFAEEFASLCSDEPIYHEYDVSGVYER